MSECVKGCAGARWWVIMPAMTPLTAHLIGGSGNGREVSLPLEQFPQRLDFVTGASTTLYERVGFTSQYRPVTVLDRLAAKPLAAEPPHAAKPKRAPRARKAADPALTPPEFQPAQAAQATRS